jgi:maleylacetoacetate isomerase
MAIAQYLEDTRPDPPLLPQDPLAKCKVLQICHQVNANIQPLQNLRVKKKLLEISDGKIDVNEWSKHWNEIGFEGLETILRETSGKFCYGDTVTMADAWVFAQAYNARTRFGVD